MAKTETITKPLNETEAATSFTTSDFSNGWESNGKTFLQKIRNVYHFHGAVRRGEVGAPIIGLGSSIAPAQAADVSSAMIYSSTGFNGYVLINTSGQIIPYNVSYAEFVSFDLFWVRD